MSQLPSVVSKPKEKPSWTYVGTHIGTHALGLRRLSVSKGDSQDLRKKLSKEYKSEEESPCLSHYDAECQKTVVAPAVGFEPTTPLLRIKELTMMGHT